MDDVQRKAREKAERLREKIRREQEEQPNRIKAPPVFPPSKREPTDKG
ncbi:MAG: hypothetical protein ACHP7P_06225 [Terriglobales bacterium]